MGRLSWPRGLVHGLVSGVLLACMRAPLGLDWTQTVAVSGSAAALFRAAALLAIGLSLRSRRRALAAGPGAAWLASVALGFALEGWVLDWSPGSRAGTVLALVAGTLLLRGLAGGAQDADGDPAAGAPASWRERAGLALVGAGALLALEALAHEVRLFTPGTSADHTGVGVAFLALLAVGAVSFGPLLRARGEDSKRLAGGLALGAGAAVAGLAFLTALGPDGLHGYLRRFDVLVDGLRGLDRALGGRLGIAGIPTLDGSAIGTLWATAILASASLVAPGLCIGATLGATRGIQRLAPVLFGAAVAQILLPGLITAFGRPWSLVEAQTVGFAWGFVAAGAGLAGIGAAVVAVARPGPRLVALSIAALSAGMPWARPGLVLWSVSPWSPSPVQPTLVWPTAEGLLTVEPGRDGMPQVTLDRWRMTPVSDELELDEHRIRIAWERLAPETRAAGVRGLFVGQMTPQRAAAFARLPGLALERTAPWPANEVEPHLFQPPGTAPGTWVSPAEARAALERGDYDWVVVPPVSGPIVTWKSEAREIWSGAELARWTALDLEAGTVGVLWWTSSALTRRGPVLEPVLVAIDRLEALSFGLVRGDVRAADLDSGPLFRLSTRPAPTPLAFLRTMPQQRSYLSTAAACAGLQSEAVPDLVRGLQIHFAAQELSSPYETRAQQVELEEDALRAFFQDVPPADRLDRLTREVWETVAWLVTEKRLPEQALVYLEPLSERFPGWTALQVALGHAYREFLEPEKALGFLLQALEARTDVPQIWAQAARCQDDLGRHADAAASWRRAVALAPTQTEYRRGLGIALARSGDPQGRPLLEDVLEQDPEDGEARRALLELLGQPPEAGADGNEDR